MKFDMRVKNIKNMQSNTQIFKICSYVNVFSGNFSHWIQPNLQLNFIIIIKKTIEITKSIKSMDGRDILDVLSSLGYKLTFLEHMRPK